MRSRSSCFAGSIFAVMILAVVALRHSRPLDVPTRSHAQQTSLPANRDVTTADVANSATNGANDRSHWAIPFGHEFWRDRKQSAAAASPRSALDLSAVVDRVTHAILTGTSTEPKAVRAQTFTVSFADSGFQFSPYQPVEAPKTTPPTDTASLAKPRSRDVVPALRPDPDAVASFETLAIRRGENNLVESNTGEHESIVHGNTVQSLRSEKQGIVEHYEVRSEGVSVTWVLGHEPAGQGNLEVDVALKGLIHITRTLAGHHFADANGNSRVRIGNVTAVDSKGARWDLAMEYENDLLQVRVPSGVLGSAAYPLAIDPLISPEFGVNQPIALPVSGSSPAIASNGRDYLLAWQISVRQPNDNYLEQIRATRVSRDGAILDPAGILL